MARGEQPERAWYVAYGSNMCRDRLLSYLEGAVAPEGHPAQRDDRRMEPF